MSVFERKIKRNWSVKVQSTDEHRERYERVQQGLKELDPDLSFSLESGLEEQVEVLLKKAEKELLQLQKAARKEKESPSEQPKKTETLDSERVSVGTQQAVTA